MPFTHQLVSYTLLLLSVIAKSCDYFYKYVFFFLTVLFFMFLPAPFLDAMVFVLKFRFTWVVRLYKSMKEEGLGLE